jgi:hypothetical protein
MFTDVMSLLLLVCYHSLIFRLIHLKTLYWQVLIENMLHMVSIRLLRICFQSLLIFFQVCVPFLIFKMNTVDETFTILPSPVLSADFFNVGNRSNVNLKCPK